MTKTALCLDFGILVIGYCLIFVICHLDFRFYEFSQVKSYWDKTFSNRKKVILIVAVILYSLGHGIHIHRRHEHRSIATRGQDKTPLDAFALLFMEGF
jgi:hypothetical protein